MIETSSYTKLLSLELLKNNSSKFGLKDDHLQLPEKVIQFGTGILLRGLVDYLIYKGNREDVFDGSVVIIKSTGNEVDEFSAQNNLYTVIEKGVTNGRAYEQKNVVTCISRVLIAQTQWRAILECASNPNVEIVVSNTTEAGLVFQQEHLNGEPPKSFPAKLTAYLFERYKTFKGDAEKGIIILPTELVNSNGEVLKQFVLQHASNNNLGNDFITWVNNNNRFCNTLVDRIVPGKSEKDDVIRWSQHFEYIDHLHTTVEPYLLWAIQGDDVVQQKLSFVKADKRAIVAESIECFKEQKLRILNGSNTTVVSAGYLAGLNTVYDTVSDPVFKAFTQQLITDEILPTITEQCLTAAAFAKEVMDRFANPFIGYPLLNVALQCSGKMNSRNAATIIRYYKLFNKYPPLQSIGLASFFLFYTPAGKENGTWYGRRDSDKYIYRDEHTDFLCSTLEGIDWQYTMTAQLAVSAIIDNDKIFSPELASLPDIPKMITALCRQLNGEGIKKTIERFLK